MKYYLVAGLFTISLMSCSKTSSKLPNVILIMADDMGKEALPLYGNITTPTPHLSQMASAGITFHNCISQPLCTPSRVKIMTGQNNYKNYEYFGYMNSNQETFGNLFQEKGYTTCIAGKWQLNGLAYPDIIPDWHLPNRVNDFGFDHYCLWQLTQPRSEGERYADPLVEADGEIIRPGKDAYGPDVFSNYILDFISEHQDQPFFVYYPMVLVHDPFVPTPDSENWADSTLRYQNDPCYFEEMVTYTDQIVGRIRAHIERLGLAEETLIIFTADNGSHPSIVSLTGNGVIRGAKGNTIGAGIQVPLLVEWKNHIDPATSYDGLISFADFYATFAELLGAETTEEIDGESFLNALLDPTNHSERSSVFVHYDPRWGKNVNRHRNQFAQTTEFKLYRDSTFYNLLEDPLENNPIPLDGLSSTARIEYLRLQQALQQELEKAQHSDNPFAVFITE
jgi:arylsulfatase A